MSKQRSADDRVRELEAKIAGIRSRDERRRAKANPAIRHATMAVKLIDKSASETSDTAARKALEDARGALSAWLALDGMVLSNAAADASEKTPGKRGRPRKNNTAVSQSGGS